MTILILTAVTALGEVVGSRERFEVRPGRPREEHGLTSLGGTWALD